MPRKVSLPGYQHAVKAQKGPADDDKWQAAETVSATLAIQSDELSGKCVCVCGGGIWSQSDLASLQGSSQIFLIWLFPLKM